MAANSDGENSRLAISVKKQTKYGTTTNSKYTNERFLKHYVKPCETLQGITLKYEATMEQIKRANNMWTNDSLFLREYLLIPILDSKLYSSGSCDSTVANGDCSANATASTDAPPEIVTRQDLNSASRMSRSKSHNAISSKHGKASDGLVSQPQPPASDFLHRFDSSLALIKCKVQELEHTSSFPEDSNNPLYLLPQRHGPRFGHRQRPASLDDSDSDPLNEPDLVFKNSRQNRQVREKLEQTHENIFQL